jgi:hypothetical protein
MNKLIKRLEQLESEIESGIRSVGKALMEIRDSKAYLGNHETFESYCKERWGFTDRHARDLIDAEAVRVKIGTLVPVETLKNKHLLEISKIPAAKQAQVAASVIADCEAENRKPTQKDFKAAAKEYIDAKPAPKQKDEPGDSEPEPIFEVPCHKSEWKDVDDTPEPEPAKPDTPQSDDPKALQAPIQAVATQLNGMLKELKRLSDHTGGEWLDISDLETQIEALKYSIRQSIYWMDCMDCGGKGCKTCRQIGWLSLDRKKHLTQAQKDLVGA